MQRVRRLAADGGRDRASRRPKLAQARRRRCGASERGDGGGVEIDGGHLTARASLQRERARAAEQVRDFFCVRERPLGELREPRLSRLGRLQEAAGRQPRQRLAEGDARRPALDHDLAVIGDAREIERIRRPRMSFCVSARPSGPEPRRSTSSPSSVAVTPISSGFINPRKSPLSARAAAIAPAMPGLNKRASVDDDDVVRARAHEADLVALAMGKAGVKGRAPPPRAMRIDQVPDLRRDALALERFDHQAALPSPIERSRHVLGGAAAAGSEPGADRRRAFGRDDQRLDELCALAIRLDQSPLAGQGAGNDRAIGREPMPMRIKRDDRNLFDGLRHGARR